MFELGNPLISAVSPYFLRNSEIGPNSMARMGQAATQAGSSPASRRSKQVSHLVILPIFSLYCGAPYGQFHSQYLHPTHLSWSIKTTPSSSRLYIAVVGQFSIHFGSSQ